MTFIITNDELVYIHVALDQLIKESHEFYEGNNKLTFKIKDDT